jgi:hypothetical protein
MYAMRPKSSGGAFAAIYGYKIKKILASFAI